MARFAREMSLERFDELVKSYGPEVGNWPEMEQESARNLLKTSEAARTLVGVELGLENLIRASEAPKAPTSLVDRIMAKAKNS